MNHSVNDTYDDMALMRRQAGIALRSLLRPKAYIGTVRELALTAVHAAAYPMGMARDANRRSTPMPDGAPVDAVADDETGRIPVILVHGWVHNRSAFLGISRALRRAGFRHIHAFDYNPLNYDIPEVAGMLAAEVQRVRSMTGADKVMIVGHSLGGVVSRYYVQQLGGDEVVDTVISLGSPHRGTYAAFLAPGSSGPQMRPGHPLMRKLQETARPSNVRWIAVYSDLDLLILPAVSAKLTHPALRAHNVKVADLGHLSLLMSGDVLRTVVEHLSDRTLHRPDPVELRAVPDDADARAASDHARRRALDIVPPLAAEG